MACRDESLYPLPYDDRTSGHYLRIYKQTSAVLDFDDLANSAFEVVFESVDENGGADLQEVEFYATHRSGATGLITDEVLVKTVSASAMGLANVPAPTYSEYLRSAPVRVTVTEITTALATLTTDPDGIPLVDCTNLYPDVCPAVAYPGSLAVADQILLRWRVRLTDGREFTIANQQTVTSPSLGNPEEANMTPNITAGQFYNAPYVVTLTVRRTTTTGTVASYTGDYRMAQVAIWSPNHSTVLHELIPNELVKPFLFGSSPTDSTQTVTLAAVAGGLPSEREFTCTYRGETITLRINLESGPNPGLSTASLTTLTGLGMAGAANANLGTVFVPLINSGVECTSTRELYMVTPLAGAFAGNTTLRFGLPRSTFPNRGYYRFDQDGLTPGQVFSISIDDDVDEYGRRNGYCTWYRTVYLTLTKI